MAPVLCPPQCVTDTALLWLHPEHLQDGHPSPLLIPQPSHPSALKTRKKSQTGAQELYSSSVSNFFQQLLELLESWHKKTFQIL